MRPHPGVFGVVLRRRFEHGVAFGSFGGFEQGHLEDFGQVQGVPVGLLGDLLAAAETVGYDQPVGGSLADGGEEFQFAYGFRNGVFISFEAEGSGHAAASGGGRGVVDAHALEDGFFGGHLHDRFVVAVAVDQSAAGEFGEREIFGALLEKFAEQEDLFRERLGAFVFGEKVGEFVAKDAGAAWFQDDDGGGGFDFGEELVHDLEEQALGAIEHSYVVERAAAAEVGAGDGYVESGGFEDLHGGFGGGREKVVVEGVGPEENGIFSEARVRRSAESAVELRSTGRPGAVVPT